MFAKEIPDRRLNKRRLRMAEWFLFSLALYAAILLNPREGGMPLLAVVALTKGANVNAGAFVGYWVDRTLFAMHDRAYGNDPTRFTPMEKGARILSRALISFACIIGFATGIGA